MKAAGWGIELLARHWQDLDLLGIAHTDNVKAAQYVQSARAHSTAEEAWTSTRPAKETAFL